MPLLNGMQPNTKGFLVMLGQIAGGINVLALCVLAVGLILVAYRFMRGEDQLPAVRKHRAYETIKRWALCLVPLAIVMILTSVRLFSMLATNTEFSGALGFLTIARAILL
jgi:hypothetical protein